MYVSLQRGEVIGGKYQIEELLGQGGMGAVVAAHHPELDQKVAVKLMLPKALAIPDAAERFVREWQILSELRSYYIPRVLDVGIHDGGVPFIVMEYLHGVDMNRLLAKCFHLRVNEATAFMIQACHAIDEAHSKGIIHRDIKPGNLFVALESDGTACLKVLDFGLSKLIDRGDGSKVETNSIGTMGSPAYMSPEQAKSAKRVDERSDIWSLGANLYHITTGELPFQADTTVETLALILYEPPIPMRELASWIPEELEAVVMRCLDKDPARRYQNARQLAAALVPFAAEQEEDDGVAIETTRKPSGQTSARVVYKPQALSRVFPHVVPTATFDISQAPSYPDPDTVSQDPGPTSLPDAGSQDSSEVTTVRKPLDSEVTTVRQPLGDDTGVTTIDPLPPHAVKSRRWVFPVALAAVFLLAISLPFLLPFGWFSSAESQDDPSPAQAGTPPEGDPDRAENSPGDAETTGSRSTEKPDSAHGAGQERAARPGEIDRRRRADGTTEADTLPEAVGATGSRSQKRASKRRKDRERAARRNKRRNKKNDAATRSRDEDKETGSRDTTKPEKPSKDNPFNDIF